MNMVRKEKYIKTECALKYVWNHQKTIYLPVWTKFRRATTQFLGLFKRHILVIPHFLHFSSLFICTLYSFRRFDAYQNMVEDPMLLYVQDPPIFTAISIILIAARRWMNNIRS